MLDLVGWDCGASHPKEGKDAMKRFAFFAALVVAAISLVAGSAAAAGGTAVKASVVYNSTIPNGPRSNLPSVGPEAYAFNEFGNEAYRPAPVAKGKAFEQS